MLFVHLHPQNVEISCYVNHIQYKGWAFRKSFFISQMCKMFRMLQFRFSNSLWCMFWKPSPTRRSQNAMWDVSGERGIVQYAQLHQVCKSVMDLVTLARDRITHQCQTLERMQVRRKLWQWSSMFFQTQVRSTERHGTVQSWVLESSGEHRGAKWMRQPRLHEFARRWRIRCWVLSHVSFLVYLYNMVHPTWYVVFRDYIHGVVYWYIPIGFFVIYVAQYVFILALHHKHHERCCACWYLLFSAWTSCWASFSCVSMVYAFAWLVAHFYGRRFYAFVAIAQDIFSTEFQHSTTFTAMEKRYQNKCRHHGHMTLNSLRAQWIPNRQHIQERAI